mgnify:CR=1 FL=1
MISNARIDATSVAVEFDPDRMVHAGTVDVDNSAAAAHLTRLADLRHGPVARDHEAAKERLGLALPAGSDLDGARADVVRRRKKAMERGGGDHGDRWIGVAEPEERVERDRPAPALSRIARSTARRRAAECRRRAPRRGET